MRVDLKRRVALVQAAFPPRKPACRTSLAPMRWKSPNMADGLLPLRWAPFSPKARKPVLQRGGTEAVGKSHQPHSSGRPGETRDIANASIYLASDDASYITGHVLVVDGGWTAGFGREW
jgi:NAD(P)-dependent dehydrogenase (short-subunit alcohol dehydrogenase family)